MDAVLIVAIAVALAVAGAYVAFAPAKRQSDSPIEETPLNLE